jgi:membrane protein implicated in regulation of membrane protease activity
LRDRRISVAAEVFRTFGVLAVPVVLLPWFIFEGDVAFGLIQFGLVVMALVAVILICVFGALLSHPWRRRNEAPPPPQQAAAACGTGREAGSTRTPTGVGCGSGEGFAARRGRLSFFVATRGHHYEITG